MRKCNEREKNSPQIKIAAQQGKTSKRQSGWLKGLRRWLETMGSLAGLFVSASALMGSGALQELATPDSFWVFMALLDDVWSLLSVT
jgi:hypothetical protein